MRSMGHAVCAVMLGALLWPSAASARPQEMSPGVWIEDFEGGSLDGWKIEKGHARIEVEKGNAVLECGGATLWLGDETFNDFSLEAKIRRTYTRGGNVGFVFRGGYRVYIKLVGKIWLDGPGGVSSRGISRKIDTDEYRTLKIVCAGPVVRFYVDGTYEGQVNGLVTDAGRVGLFGGGKVHNVYFDDVKLDTHVVPGEFLIAEPSVPDNTLVFPPEENVRVDFTLTNASDRRQQAEFGVSVETWGGRILSPGVTRPVVLDAGLDRTLTVDLGRIPRGYHKMVVKPMNRILPLAIQGRGHHAARKPDIVIGAYWYYFHWKLPEVWWKTYTHAAARDLRDHHFNTVINGVGMPPAVIDILESYGISSFSRGRNLDHPNVLGAFIGDEPKRNDIPKYVERYAKAHAKHPDKLLTTCMIGDAGLKGHVYEAWEALAEYNQIRMFRWYGIKKSWEGINRRRGDRPSYLEVLRQARVPEGDYWIILPSFGHDGPDAFYGNPLPSQIKAMMHLAVASKAKGVVFYTYQTPWDGKGFVQPESLVPEDSKWAAAGEAAEKIGRQAELLSTLTFVGTTPFVDDYAIEPFVLKSEEHEYYYLVNKDERKAVNFRLFRLDPRGSLYDLYGERSVPIREESVTLLVPDAQIETGVAHLSLEPGEGTLLEYKPRGDVQLAAAPRAEFPAWVDAAPEANVRYLMDLKPENQPMPGWVPGGKHDKNPWTTLNKDVTLYAHKDDAGQLYKKSLFAQSETTIEYRLPAGYTTFVAAAGLGNKNEKASVVFRVLVDGKEAFNSDTYRVGRPVLPVVVDIAGATTLTLATEEAGDGIYHDYAWWGEARLIRK